MDRSRWERALYLQRNEKEKNRRYGIHGWHANRWRGLAARALHRWSSAAWARGLLRRGLSRYPYNPVTYTITKDYSYAVKTLAKLATQFAFEGRWSFCARHLPDSPYAGLPKSKIVELYREADAILNVCGLHEFDDDLFPSERVVYVESDPGVEQIKVDKDDMVAIDYLRKHHALFTFGESIGTHAFPVPLHGFTWKPTRQPVVTDFWKTDSPSPRSAVFTSVANWSTSGIKDIEWRGENYLWSKSLEFLKFVEAPAHAGEEFELATTSQDESIRQLFSKNRWRLADALTLSIDHNRYKAYLQNSKGEFTVAKDQYVRLRTGWFSDRSACYLAAGRPVITQETGFTEHSYGGKRGLFAFQTLDDIAEAVRQINADYTTHCRAAFEIAAEFFEAEKVLASLLERIGI